MVNVASEVSAAMTTTLFIGHFIALFTLNFVLSKQTQEDMTVTYLHAHYLFDDHFFVDHHHHDHFATCSLDQ